MENRKAAAESIIKARPQYLMSFHPYLPMVGYELMHSHTLERQEVEFHDNLLRLDGHLCAKDYLKFVRRS